MAKGAQDRFRVRNRLEELVFGLQSAVEDERKLCLIWLSQIGTAEVLPHIEKLSTDPAIGVRSLARQLAAELRSRIEVSRDFDPASDPAALLINPNPRARLAGALMCYERQGPELRDLLMTRLEIEEDLFVRASLVKALGQYAEPAVIQKVAECMLDPDPRVRSNSIEALMHYEHPALFARVSHLLGDPDNRVRGTVLVYIGRRRPEKIQPLLESMAESTEGWARRTARYCFRALGWPVPAGLEPSRLVREVEEVFQSSDHELRIQGVWRALTLEREDRLEILRAQLKRETHPFVIATLTRALGSPGATEDLLLLERYLSSEDARIRANTMEGIAKIGGPAALRLIEARLEDPSPRVRSTASQLLIKVKKQHAVDALRKLLDSESTAEMIGALHALSQMEEEEANHVLKTVSAAWDPGRKETFQTLLEGVDPKFAASYAKVSAHGEPASRSHISVPGPATESRALAGLGMETVRLWEADEFQNEWIAPCLLELRGVEEILTQGDRLEETLPVRHRLLVRIGQSVLELARGGQIEHAGLKARAASVASSLRPSASVEIERHLATGSAPGASPDPKAWRAPDKARDRADHDVPGLPVPVPASGPSTAPVAGSTRGVMSLGGRLRGWTPLAVAILSLVLLIGIVGEGLLRYRNDPAVPRDAGVRLEDIYEPTPKGPRVRTQRLRIGRTVDWEGQVRELDPAGQVIVMENHGRPFTVTLTRPPSPRPVVAQRYRVKGTLTGVDHRDFVEVRGAEFSAVPDPVVR